MGEVNIGGRKVTHANVDQIAGDQICCGNRVPPAVAENSRPRRQSAAQQHQRLARPALLKKADHGVEHQERPDDRCFSALVQQNLDEDGGFEHPGNGSPEFLQQGQDSVRASYQDLVGAVLFEAALRLGGS